MPSLDDHFSSLAKIHTPEGWPDLDALEPRSAQSPDVGQPRRLRTKPLPRQPVHRLAAAALALVVAIAGIGFAIRAFEGVSRSPKPRLPLEESPPTREPATVIPGAFYPSTYREGDRVVMPITFVDGTTAELLLDENLRPSELGTYGEIAGGLAQVDRSMYFRYGDDSAFKGSGPIATYEGHGGTTVEEWTPPPGTFICPNLVFRFGDWFVGVRTCQDDLSAEEKAEWAGRLLGRQTKDGFLILEAIPPLRIAQAEEHAGPRFWLQGSDEGWPFITITPTHCDPDKPPSDEELRVMDDGRMVSFARTGGTWYASWCEDGDVTVRVESPDRKFVEAAAEGLRVRDVSFAEP